MNALQPYKYTTEMEVRPEQKKRENIMTFITNNC